MLVVHDKILNSTYYKQAIFSMRVKLNVITSNVVG